MATSIPVIDPRVRTVGVSKLRELSAAQLQKQSDREETLIIQVNDRPLMVMVNYDTYISLQHIALAQPGFLTVKK